MSCKGRAAKRKFSSVNITMFIVAESEISAAVAEDRGHL